MPKFTTHIIFFRKSGANTFKYALLMGVGFLFFSGNRLFAQDKRDMDGRSWWEHKDTCKYAPTGYVAASFGFVDDGNLSFNPAFFISAAKPFGHSFMGIAVRAGYNSVPTDVAGKWFTQFYFAAGPLATFQLSEHSAFDLRLLGGVMYCRYPEQNYLNNTTTSNNSAPYTLDSTIFYTFDIKGANAIEFFYQFGLGFRFEIKKRIGLLFNVDYMGLRADFNTTITTNTVGANVNEYNTATGSVVRTNTYLFNNPASTYPITFEPTSSHNNGYTMFTLGICYRLGDATVLK